MIKEKKLINQSLPVLLGLYQYCLLLWKQSAELASRWAYLNSCTSKKELFKQEI